ncbi:hypothetical protein [Streptomyces albidoflavus]|uniref:hypothetical protein n=1 Tax=Streptomyces albidoflavus TaxID=1886 RepID=UPI000AF114B3|nr:hypothetical protein [Streptomyces albidoflavus]
MILALIVWPAVALLAAGALIALAPGEPGQHLLPAFRTVALIGAAAVYIAAIWSSS